jgi:predicted transcriptional regulator of viral defense system
LLKVKKYFHVKNRFIHETRRVFPKASSLHRRRVGQALVRHRETRSQDQRIPIELSQEKRTRHSHTSWLVCSHPSWGDPELYPVDPFLVAAKLTKDAILSYHTGLEIHGRAYSVREHLTYSAARPVSPVTFRSRIFRGVRFPQALCRAGKENFGVITVDRAGLKVRVTSLERTLVDVLGRPDLSGSWEEIWRSLESVEFFDLDRVVEYTLLLGNATTTAKVGFFLEQHRESLMVEDEHLKPLHDRRPRQPHYLDSSNRKSGKLVGDWNLMLPAALYERNWGEVL